MMFEPDEIPDVASRRSARPDRRRTRRRVAGRRGRGRRGAGRRARRACCAAGAGALLGSLLRPYRRRLSFAFVLIVINTICQLLGPWLVQEGIDKGIPPLLDGGSGDVKPLAAVDRRLRRRHPRRRDDVQRLPAADRTGRPGRAARSAPPRLHALPAAQHVVPRALHVGPGDLAADLRHRSDRADVHRRRRHPRDVGAADRRHRHRDVAARPEARDRGARVVPDPVGAHALVPQPLRTRVPRDARRDRARDRALRREPRRHPGRARVPARAEEPGDLRPPRRPLPRREHVDATPRRRVRPRRAVRRPHHDRGRDAVRRLAHDRGAGQRRHARRVPPLPAPVLRADAGAEPVLQPVPGRRPRASRSSRACSTRRRAFPSPSRPCRCRTRAARCEFEGVEFAYRERIVLPHLDLDIPAGQTVALVGATGAGKTTIARLAARFWDPTAGHVRLDGIDVRDLDRDRPAPRRGRRHAGELHVQRNRRGEHRARAARTRPPARSRPRPARSVRTTSSPRFPTVTTPTSTRRARGSRPASASSSRSRARSSPTRPC